MVTYSDPIYDRWLEILEGLEEGKKPPTTVFRYLCGLEESEVQSIQEEIKDEKIFLSKTSKDSDMIDMYDRVKQLKQDKLVQEAVLEGFNNLNASSPCKDWEEVVRMYDINDAVYKTILTLCEEWIRSSLKRGTKKIAFPEEAMKYMQWAVHLQQEKVEPIDLPWSIYVVSLQMEGNLYLKRHFNNEIPIGLCVLDLIKNNGGSVQWSKETITNALKGILAIAGGSTDPGFVFLAFVDFTTLTKLQRALQNMGDDVSYHCCGPLHHFPSAPYRGAIQFLTVVAFFGQGNAFEDLRRRSNEHPMSIDCSLLQVADEGMSISQHLEAKKRVLVKQHIHAYCFEDRKLVDLFGDGLLVAEEGLHQKKEVICLVESVEEQKALATRLLDFAKAHTDIEIWAGLQAQQSTQQTNSNVPVGNTSASQEEEHEEEQPRPQFSVEQFLNSENRML